jgi:hypothetical protein
MLAAILPILGLALKLIIMLYESYKATPAESRSKHLADVDAAITKAKDTKDLSDLSKLLGKGL